MVITWYGQSCFKLQSGDLTIVTDPFSKDIGLQPPRFKADILLVSHAHPDHSNLETIAGEPFLIAGPGEYETRGVYVEGIETFHDANSGKERGTNTIYKIEAEGLKIAHLGDFGEKEMRNETAEDLGDVDILLIPCGGKYTIDGGEAAKIVKQIEPRFVIPMHYKIPGLKLDLEGPERFLKEMGATKLEALDKFSVKKKEINEDEEKIEVALLKAA